MISSLQISSRQFVNGPKEENGSVTEFEKVFVFSYEIIFLDIHADEESVIQAVKSRLSSARKSPTNEDHENLRKITDFFWALGPQVILLPGIKLTPGRGLA